MADERHQNALPNGYQFEGYRIEGVLGAGSFGVTYKARELVIDRLVAIKEYMPAGIASRNPDDSSVRPISSADSEEFEWGLDRFQKEAATLVSFSHPNIVPVYRFFTENGTAYMVMEYQQGQSLAELLIAGRTLNEAEIYDVIDPLLEGLERVHATGFLHRDIKPGNIYIRDDGSPVLIDFGAARQALGGRSQNLTRIFTPGYAPHEQYETSGHQGPWTDIYALGAVMYLLVADEPPVDAPTRLSSQARGNPDPLKSAVKAGGKGYSRQLLETIDRSLSIMEADRPQTVAELRGDLLGRHGEEVPSGRIPQMLAPREQQADASRPTPGGTIGPRAAARASRSRPAAPAYAASGRPSERRGSGGRRSARTLIYAALGVVMLGGAGVASYVATDGFGTGEASRQAEIAKRKAEEARLAEERRKAEEAQRQAEAKRQAEEAARQAEANRQAGEAARQAEAKRRAEEAARNAEAKRRAAEAARKAEAKRRAAEAARNVEAKRRAAEAARKAEIKRRAEEKARQAEAKRRAEEAARRRAEEGNTEETRRRAEAERRRQEAARRQAELERKRREEAARGRAGIERQRREEAARRRAETERRRRVEIARRRREEAARRRAGNGGSTRAPEVASLSGARIRAAVGRKIISFQVGFGAGDRFYRIRFLPGGRLAGAYTEERSGYAESTESGNDSGSWTLSGNRLCLRWRSWRKVSGCYTVTDRNGALVARGGGGVLPRSFRLR